MQDLPASPASAVSGRGRRFGPWQAVWVVLGFGLVQFFGGLFAVFARGIVIGVIAGLRHEHARVPPASAQFLAFAAIAAYALAGLWCYRFVRRRAGALLHDGGPSGIGLCPAPRASYAAAVGLAVALVGVVTLLFRFVPPDRRAAPQLLFARALAGSLESHLLLLALILTLILFVGPLVEEFVFRGAALAGLDRAVRHGRRRRDHHAAVRRRPCAGEAALPGGLHRRGADGGGGAVAAAALPLVAAGRALPRALQFRRDLGGDAVAVTASLP